MKRIEAITFMGKDELYRQLAYTKLRIALLAQQENEAKVLLNAEASKSALAEEQKFFTDTQDRTIRRIRVQLLRQSAQNFARYDLRKIVRAAAAVLLVFYLGLTTAVATVQSVRVNLMKLLYNVEEQYTEISFQPDEEAAFEVPAEWAGNYFMSYIPNGYSFAFCSPPSTMEQEIIYTDSAGRMIRFCEMALQLEANIDTEGFSVMPVQVNGASGIIAEKATEVTVVWPAVDRYFMLNANCTRDEVIRIAKQVIRIK